MNTFLYSFVDIINEAHSYILTLNDAYEANFTDKELHFLVIGLLGMALVLIIQPIFKLLAKTGHVLVITWIYVFTLILVLTLSIEIEQKITGSGVMDAEDISFGVWGFLLMFLIYAIIRGIIKGIWKLFKR